MEDVESKGEERVREKEWISTHDQLPENGMVVETKIDDAMGCSDVSRLKRMDNLWFLPSGSMYVYYEPTHWRESE